MQTNPATPTKKERTLESVLFFLVSHLRGRDSNSQFRQSGGLSSAAVLAGATFILPQAKCKRIPPLRPRRRSLRTAQRKQSLDAAAFSSAVLRVSSFSPRDPLRWARVGPPFRGYCYDTHTNKERTLESVLFFFSLRVRAYLFSKGSALERPVQKRDDLRPGADLVGGEGRRAGALGDPVFHRPPDRLCIARIPRHI